MYSAVFVGSLGFFRMGAKMGTLVFEVESPRCVSHLPGATHINKGIALRFKDLDVCRTYPVQHASTKVIILGGPHPKQPPKSRKNCTIFMPTFFMLIVGFGGFSWHFRILEFAWPFGSRGGLG